ncbi:cytochrome P450 [Amanita muscaria]
MALSFPELLQSQTIAIALLCLTLLSLIRKRLNSSTNLPLPPGPPRHWLFGNTIPKIFGYRKFEEWTKQYGPVFSLQQGLQTIIVIGRVQAAIDVMEKEGTHTADRPRCIAAGETLSGGMRLLMTPAGERFKKMRRALHAYLQPKIVATYGSTIMDRAKQHILDIIEDPIKHQDHAKRYSASVVMVLAYGQWPKGRDDPDIGQVNDCLTRLGNNMRPGYWKVDFYPFLKYVPGYLKELQDGHVKELGLFQRKLFEVRDRMARGEEVQSCFGKYLLERQKELELSDGETAYLAGSMFGAGSDTTASGISVAVMAAACYPNAQRRVQQELEQVIGRNRAPTMADMEVLPQTHAYVLETLRWRPVTAGGFPHRATKELIWGGYRIPEGAIVIGNAWAIGRDPQYFPDPEKFNPQRWFDSNGKLREDLKNYAFGLGRRVCPGQHIATSSIFLNTALILWAMTVEKDPNHPIDELAFTESANAHPMPFKVIFGPRAAETFDGVKELLDEYGI